MKHAGAATLQTLEALLARLRGLPGLVEKRPGVFYAGSRAYLHFHDDPAGLFADVRLGGDRFDRLPVSTQEQQQLLLALVIKNRA
jgi:hypothetical protein